MCIMEVRPGQHSSTIAQACAHNLSTIDRDLDMFVAVLSARGDVNGRKQMLHVQDLIHHAYADALSAFEDEVALEVAHWHHHDDEEPHTHGNERDVTDPETIAALNEYAHHVASLARPYETR